MGGCAAVNCSNHSNRKWRMFKFPADEERKKKWLVNCRRANWKPTKHSQLCIAHFEESQFETHRADKWKKLKPNAVPTLFNVPNPPQLLTSTQMKLIGIPKRPIMDESSIIEDQSTYNIEENIKRAANFSLDELETIVYHMELRPDLVSGFIGAEYKTVSEQKEAWQEIADAVNYFNMDQVRNPLEVKRKWQDFKYRVKAKVERMTQNESLAEEGTPLHLRLTPLEERVVTLLATAYPSSLAGLNLDSLLQKTQCQNESDIEEEEHCRPVNIEDKIKKTVQLLDFNINKDQAGSSNLNSTTKNTSTTSKTTSTERVRLFRKRKAITRGLLHSNLTSQNNLVEEIKELKNEIKKLRECVQDLVNLKKTTLELKCLKYGVQIEDL